jgi:hypothetical protein
MNKKNMVFHEILFDMVNPMDYYERSAQRKKKLL